MTQSLNFSPDLLAIARRIVKPQMVVLNLDADGGFGEALQRECPQATVRTVPPGTALDEACFRNDIRRIDYLRVGPGGDVVRVLSLARELLRRGRIDFIEVVLPADEATRNALIGDFETLKYEVFFAVEAADVRSPALVVADRMRSTVKGDEPVMLDVAALCRQHGITPRGVVHLGAHDGQELKTYLGMNARRVLLVEANPNLHPRLDAVVAAARKTSGAAIGTACCAVSNANGTATLRVTSGLQSSSILPLKDHSVYYPSVVETAQVEVPARRLDDLLEEKGLPAAEFNLLSIDIQGAELMALQGAHGLLEHIDGICTEVNYKELYGGCPHIDDLDEFLERYGFERVATTTPYHPSWGDAFYVKRRPAALRAVPEQEGQLRAARLKLIELWLSTPADRLQSAYEGELGKAHREVIAAGLLGLPLSEQEAGVAGQLVGMLEKNPASARAASAAMGALLLCPAEQVMRYGAVVPGWLVRRHPYLGLLVPKQESPKAGAAGEGIDVFVPMHARHAGRVVDCVRSIWEHATPRPRRVVVVAAVEQLPLTLTAQLTEAGAEVLDEKQVGLSRDAFPVGARFTEENRSWHHQQLMRWELRRHATGDVYAVVDADVQLLRATELTRGGRPVVRRHNRLHAPAQTLFLYCFGYRHAPEDAFASEVMVYDRRVVDRAIATIQSRFADSAWHQTIPAMLQQVAGTELLAADLYGYFMASHAADAFVSEPAGGYVVSEDRLGQHEQNLTEARAGGAAWLRYRRFEPAVPGVLPRVVRMSSLGSNGRFGNQLFQYAFLRIYGERHGLKAETPAWVGGGLFGHVDGMSADPLPVHRDEATDPDESSVLKAKAPLAGHDLWGYFQLHTRFYRPHRETFRGLFQPLPPIKAAMDQAVARLREGGRTVVALHLRRGDFGSGPFWIAPSAWYVSWLAEVWPTLRNPVLYVASDEPEKVVADFAAFGPVVTSKDLGVTLTGAEFYVDFYVLSQADVVATSNSSFSFVAAMLNDRATEFVRPDVNVSRVRRFDPWDDVPFLVRRAVPPVEAGAEVKPGPVASPSIASLILDLKATEAGRAGAGVRV